MATGRSIVDYFKDSSGNPCGYCSQEDTSFSNGMWAHMMTVQDYQSLIDRGWRRSGKYCYKPVMDKTCCPQYPIKCKAGDYRPSKSNKKVIKRFNKYINSGVRPSKAEEQAIRATMEVNGEDFPQESMTSAPLEDMADTDVDLSRVPVVEERSSGPVVSPAGQQDTQQESKDNPESSGISRGETDTGAEARSNKTPTPGKGPDPSKPRCQKAKAQRRERWLKKQGNIAGQPQAPEGKSKEPKSLETLLREVVENPVHKLEVRLVRSSPRSGEFEASFNESYAVYKQYQMAIHGDPPDKPTERQYTRFLVDSPLQVRLVRSKPRRDEFDASFAESYSVYQRYQMTVHGDTPTDCDQATFTQFLVDSPLKAFHRVDGFSSGYGSFHQQYLIDGKIVAVGVIDILPSCVSSVYLYYDPDYFFLSLGTYTAVRELAFTQYIHTLEPSVEYYYMGYYIHSCPKMRYKGQYSPSFLLCPETYKWVAVEECRSKLDVNKYSRFSDAGEVDTNGNIDIDKVLVLYMHQAMPYFIYRQLNDEANDTDEVLEYARFTGRKCAELILLYRS